MALGPRTIGAPAIVAEPLATADGRHLKGGVSKAGSSQKVDGWMQGEAAAAVEGGDTDEEELAAALDLHSLILSPHSPYDTGPASANSSVPQTADQVLHPLPLFNLNRLRRGATLGSSWCRYPCGGVNINCGARLIFFPIRIQ